MRPAPHGSTLHQLEQPLQYFTIHLWNNIHLCSEPTHKTENVKAQNIFGHRLKRPINLSMGPSPNNVLQARYGGGALTDEAGVRPVRHGY